MRVNATNLRRYTWPIVAVAVLVLAVGILMASRSAAPHSEETFAAEMAESSEAVVAEVPKASSKKTPGRKAAAPVARSSKPAAGEVKAAPSEEKAASTGLETVTISGCLERDDDVYRLKNTEGSNAPKARSWKSGFLKKGSSKLEVIDASNRLRLQNHVGHRVSITGTVYEREMLANSVRHVSDSCER